MYYGFTIDLSSVAAIMDFADLVANHLSQIGPNAVIDDLAGNTITRTNTLMSNLHMADFVF